jgi:hypothetical protein
VQLFERAQVLSFVALFCLLYTGTRSVALLRFSFVRVHVAERRFLSNASLESSANVLGLARRLVQENDFAKSAKSPKLVVSTPVVVTQALPVLQSASNVPIVSASNVPIVAVGTNAQIVSVVAESTHSNLGVAAKRVAQVIRNAASQHKMLATAESPPAPPPPVKVDKQTQKGLEDMIRSLRKAQEEREMKFMKEAALDTAKEIALDKAHEEKKASLAHQQHVEAVNYARVMHNSRDWVHDSENSPHHPASDEVEQVLKKAMQAQDKAKAKAAEQKKSESKQAKAAPVKTVNQVKHLTVAQEQELKLKAAAEAKMLKMERIAEDKRKAEEKAKVDKLAAQLEAHQDAETAMIETRQDRVVLERNARNQPAVRKPKLSPKAQEKIELQKRIQKMLEVYTYIYIYIYILINYTGMYTHTHTHTHKEYMCKCMHVNTHTLPYIHRTQTRRWLGRRRRFVHTERNNSCSMSSLQPSRAQHSSSRTRLQRKSSRLRQQQRNSRLMQLHKSSALRRMLRTSSRPRQQQRRSRRPLLRRQVLQVLQWRRQLMPATGRRSTKHS